MHDEFLREIQQELLKLDTLREQVRRDNDIVGSLFRSLHNDDTPVHTYAELEAAIIALGTRVPHFQIMFSNECYSYALFPAQGE